MSTTLTSKGQVTIPKHIRDALHLKPGSGVEFSVDAAGSVVLKPAASSHPTARRDRFQAVRGSATVKWRTDELMQLLRSDA